ncbi:divalent metal cation transporter [Mesorhizobium sp. AR02]|uniref:divalent metal cation transporter n=1 Tax=Mesorhizobium sp. AR02 TaxID=2865837 RepID=UPI003A5C3462
MLRGGQLRPHYFGTVMFVHVPWTEVANGLFIPRFTLDAPFWTAVVAIFGTTISPYLFFWQASQEVEDQKAKPLREPLKEAPQQAENAINVSVWIPILAWRFPTLSRSR